jgi:hypothetical protein
VREQRLAVSSARVLLQEEPERQAQPVGLRRVQQEPLQVSEREQALAPVQHPQVQLVLVRFPARLLRSVLRVQLQWHVLALFHARHGHALQRLHALL